MKGRKPLYSVSAGERHVRPGDVAAPPLPGALPAALLPAVDSQANGHNGQHTQESAHATNGEATSCWGTEAESCAAGRASSTAGRLGACAG